LDGWVVRTEIVVMRCLDGERRPPLVGEP